MSDDGSSTGKPAANVELEALLAQVTAKKQQFDEFVGAAIATIEESKNTAVAAKGAIETTQQAATADLDAINQSKLEVDNLKSAAVTMAQSLAAEDSKISSSLEELQKKAEPLEQILTTLTEISDEAQTERASVTADVAAINEARERFKTLNTQTQGEYDALVIRKVTLDTQISEIGAAHEQIKQISKSLFDDTEKVSVRTEIEELRTQIAGILKQTTEQRDLALAFFETFKEDTDEERKALIAGAKADFDKLHEVLQTQILTLLPSAGAAGLASTYYDAKARYAPTSYAGKPGGGAERMSLAKWVTKRLFGYNPASVVATVFFYALFILPILCIVYIFYDVLHHLPNGNINNLDLKILLLRGLIALPLATISAFGFTSLRQYRRLYEEYNHKQRVMELYASFRKEIEDNGTDDQKKALLTIMLDAVADKTYLAQGTAGGKEGGAVMSELNNITTLLNNLLKIKT